MDRRTRLAALVFLVGLVIVIGVLKHEGRSAARQRASAAEGARPAAEASSTASDRAASQHAESKEPAAKGRRLPMLLDLGRGECLPCQQMLPILEELRKKLAGKVEIRYVDLGENPSAADRWHIQVIPTQIFLDPEGKEVYRHVGVLEVEEALAKMRELGWLAEKPRK
jgi:thioredoxin 1